MKPTILIIGIILLLISFADAQPSCESEAESGENNEKAGLYDMADDDYVRAGACYERRGAYDNCAKYYLKAAELGMEYTGGGSKVSIRYAGAARCLEKAGKHESAVEYCDKAKDWLFNNCKDSDRDYSMFINIAECYKNVDDKEKACYYCDMANNYQKNKGESLLKNCMIYKCPFKHFKSEGGTSGKDTGTSGSTISETSGGENTGSDLPILPIAAAAVISLIIIAFFLLKKK